MFTLELQLFFLMTLIGNACGFYLPAAQLKHHPLPPYGHIPSQIMYSNFNMARRLPYIHEEHIHQPIRRRPGRPRIKSQHHDEENGREKKGNYTLTLLQANVDVFILTFNVRVFKADKSVTLLLLSVCCSKEPASMGVHLRDFDEPYVQPTVPQVGEPEGGCFPFCSIRGSGSVMGRPEKQRKYDLRKTQPSNEVTSALQI